jgi:FixJ family two-component response regulator
MILNSVMPAPPLIAIVDDDALARDGVGELVQSLGYRTAAFSSAEHFLQSNVITETTCLITDLQNAMQQNMSLFAVGPP